MPVPWRLTYDGADLEFGTAASGLPLAAAPEYGNPDIDTDDRMYPYGDGVIMGSDRRAGSTITFDLHAVAASEALANEVAGRMATAWRADAIRSVVGGAAELVAPSGRRAIGRPRRWSLDETLARYGKYQILADFQTVDDLWYSDAKPVSATLGYRAAGGITFPAKFPLTTSPESDRSQTFIVDGEVPTWAVYEITGPVLSPWLEIPGVARYSFTGLRLAYDQWLTIDTRPWAREVYRNDGAPLGGALDVSSTLLSSNPLPPGQHELLLRGTTTGTPRATATWRDAFTTP